MFGFPMQVGAARLGALNLYRDAPGELTDEILEAGLEVIGRLDAPPSPKTTRDTSDPLHFARSQEVVSLWRLRTSV